jgi:type IV fimbrial biogenesis protein FimT
VNRAYPSGKITANRRSFAFRPFEIRSTNGTLIFCDRRGPEFARAVIISYTGRPRTYPAAGLGKPFSCGD